MAQLQPELSELFAEYFRAGNSFSSITEARRYVGYLVEPGTSAAKLIEESIEAGVVRAARDLVQKEPDPLSAYEQCLDLYNRMPALNTRTSTSVLQQAYSTPVPIAFLAAKLADIHRDATVYEPSAGNGSLLLLANPKNSIVNELNPDRAAELRAQGFNVTQEDASTFVPQVLPVDRVITNPPFGSVKDALGQNRMFRQGLLITSQIDQAIALKALDLMKPDGKAVLILGGKMGDEDSRKEQYNTQLSRGFYRWLYKDAGYKVTDHFSIAGSLYRKQGAGFPIDLLLIEGKGETTLKLPAVEVPRVYSSFDELKEVLVHATQQQIEPETDSGITLQRVYSGQALDTRSLSQPRRDTPYTLDDGVSSRSTDRDRDSPRVPVSTDATSGSVNRPSDRGLARDLRTPRGTGSRHLKSGGVPLQQQVFAMWAESGGCIRCEKSYEGIEFGVEKIPVSLETAENNAQILNLIWQFDKLKEEAVESIHSDLAEAGEAAKEKNPALGDAGATSTIFTSVLHNLTAVTSLALKAEETANRVIQDIEQGRKPIIMLFNTMESTIKNFIDTHNELALAHNAEFPDSPIKRISPGDAVSITPLLSLSEVTK